MEAKLQALVNAARPENSKKWALRWKENRGKVIGVVGPNVPEEIIFAAGMLPWGASGTWDATTPHASAFRPAMTSVFCTHLLESVMNGGLDFLNGMVNVNYDDDFRHLWSVQDYMGKPRFNHIMYLPSVNNRITLKEWMNSVNELKEAVEKQVNHVITDEALRQAIDIYNETRRILREVYELRKKVTPAVTGAETLGITTAARVMPKDEFNRELRELLPYLKNRKAPLKQNKPRLLVSSSYLYHPGYIELIEDGGAVVAMDEMDTGSTYFWDSVDSSSENIWQALAERYIAISMPRMSNWREQIDRVLNWVKEFKIDGIIELRQLYSFPTEFRFTYSKKRIKEAGIPHLSLRIEYHLAGAGMLRTRVEAFLEMLREK